MPEIVNRPIVLETGEALAAAQTVFADARINWSVMHNNMGDLTMQLVGTAPTSGKKVVVYINFRSVTAVEQDRHGATIQTSQPFGSVYAACADLKRLMQGENDPFIN